MLEFKRNLLSVALASATLMATAGVHAQAAEEPAQKQDQSEAAKAKRAADAAAKDEAVELDTVRVTGIRRGIEDAIETKQSSTSIVEAISAEDIGKLPDTSIADSIARLPGVTTQRFGGRPQEINVRGTPGDFTNTTLNGREQVSLGNNRGVEFDQYPSELINQVIVYKTPDASLIGQGLAATVDLQTVRPLSFADRVIAVNLRGDMNKLDSEKKYGNRYSISYIDQFADHTVGLALGYAHLNNPGQGHQFEAWGYDGSGLFGGGKIYDLENDNTRDGFMGVLEFKPNDEFHSILDIFYSKFDKKEVKRGMEFGTAFSSATLQSRTDNAQGTAIRATWTGVKPVVRNDFNSEYDNLFAIGWKNEIKLNEDWTFNADISNSSANRDQRVLETNAGLAGARGVTGDTVTATLNPAGYFDFDFGFDYGDPSILQLSDPGGWGQDGYIKDLAINDELTSVRLDLERKFQKGFVSSLEFGANLTDRTKSRSAIESFLCLQACRDGVTRPIPANLLTTSPFGFAGVPSIVGYDALAAYRQIYNSRSNTNNADIKNKNWEVTERVTTAYVQANLDADIGPITLKGNIGVQAVNVDQSSTGAATFEGLTLDVPTQRGAHYTDYLPSMNLVFQLPDEQVIRFAAARQAARPRMDELRGNTSYAINRTPPCPASDPSPCPIWTGSSGNPELRPWLANAYDLSYEKYFGSKAYVSAAYFFKDLKTYIRPNLKQFDFSQVPIPASVLPVDIPASSIGEFRQPVNDFGGYIRGYELAASFPLEMLWGPLEGFGAVASYSVTDSSISPNGANTPEHLQGLSKYVSNVTLYYERYGFSTRVSQRTRTSFFGEVQGFGGDRTRDTFGGEKVIDLQLGYTIQSGPLKDVSLLLQVNNIENTPFTSSFNGRADRPKAFAEYGRTYLLGVNYKF